MKNFLILIICLFQILLTAQSKQSSFTGSIKYKMTTDDNQSEEFTMYFGKNKTMMDISSFKKYKFYDRTISEFLNKNTNYYIINDDKKTIDKSIINSFKPLNPQKSNIPNETTLQAYSVTPYTINSTKNEYLGANFETKFELLIADDLYFSVPNSTATQDIYCANGTGRIALGVDKTMYSDQAIGGLQFGKLTTIRAIEIKEYDVPNEVFEIPKGYKLIEKGNLGLE